MYLPITIIIPNIGPPSLNVAPKDVTITVGDLYYLRFSGLSDPDPEDVPFVALIDFGGA